MRLENIGFVNVFLICFLDEFSLSFIYFEVELLNEIQECLIFEVYCIFKFLLKLQKIFDYDNLVLKIDSFFGICLKEMKFGF